MLIAIDYSLPPDAKLRLQTEQRIAEVLEILNADREEQAIDPDNFMGNIADYPDWLAASFEQPALARAVEACCEFDAGELADWDLQTWYEDLLGCESWNYTIKAAGLERRALVFEAEGSSYGGDISHTWLLFAAGAVDVQTSHPV